MAMTTRLVRAGAFARIGVADQVKKILGTRPRTAGLAFSWPDDLARRAPPVTVLSQDVPP